MTPQENVCLLHRRTRKCIYTFWRLKTLVACLQILRMRALANLALDSGVFLQKNQVLLTAVSDPYCLWTSGVARIYIDDHAGGAT
jgi:hypothetical protein